MDIFVPLLNDLIELSDDWHQWQDTLDGSSDELQQLDSIIIKHCGNQALATLGATRLDRMRGGWEHFQNG